MLLVSMSREAASPIKRYPLDSKGQLHAIRGAGLIALSIDRYTAQRTVGKRQKDIANTRVRSNRMLDRRSQSVPVSSARASYHSRKPSSSPHTHHSEEAECIRTHIRPQRLQSHFLPTVETIMSGQLEPPQCPMKRNQGDVADPTSRDRIIDIVRRANKLGHLASLAT